MKYLEDFSPGERETMGTHTLAAEEIVEFARRWDPQEMHTSITAAAASPFGGLIASGAHLMALSVRLLVERKQRAAIIAGLGWDEVRFLEPARPGDILTATRTCIQARPSASRPGEGVVRNRITLVNQHGRTVLSYVDAILVAARHAAPSTP
jgi:acyl dehydratase